MSTKCTLVCKCAKDDTDFHLYEECYEADAVYLTMNNAHFEASDNHITVRIPLEVFRMIGSADLVESAIRHSESVKENWEGWVQTGKMDEIKGEDDV